MVGVRVSFRCGKFGVYSMRGNETPGAPTTLTAFVGNVLQTKFLSSYLQKDNDYKNAYRKVNKVST